MLKSGLINEIKELLNQGITFNDQCMQAIGYKEFKDYFENKASLDECVEKVKVNTRHFVKRQYTWFNNQMPIEWYDDKDKALIEIDKWRQNEI